MATHLLKTKTAGYRPIRPGAPSALYGLPTTRGFSLAQVEAMREDPQVSLCLSYRGVPLSVARLKFKARDERVARFVRRQFRRLWRGSLPVALEALPYGHSASEVLYKKEGGRYEFDRLKYLSPRDVAVWTRQGRAHHVELSSGSRGGRADRPEAAPGAVELPCSLKGLPAKGFWFVHDPLYDPWYGRSVCVGAWLPWRLKTLPGGGGMDAISKWFYRHGYRGYTVRHPDAVYQDDANQTPLAAQDLAQQMMESMKVGADVAMSSAKDEHGDYLWKVESYGEVNGSAADMIEYVKGFLDVQIQRGVGIPDGVITDDGAGGYAGRKIPEDAYYAACEQDLNALVELFDEQVVWPLVRLNFGKGSPYAVAPLPLVPVRQQAAQEQQQGALGGDGENPLAGLAGGAGADGQQDSGPGGTFPMSFGRKRMAAADQWQSYHGKRTTSTAWINPRTKEVRYQEAKPGSRHTGRGEGAAGRRDAAARSLKAAMQGGWEVFKAAGAKARHVEHVASEFVEHGVDERIERLPPRAGAVAAAVWKLTKLGTKAAFVTYVAGQKAARAAAEAAGASPEHAAALAGFCTALDLAGAKAVPLTLAAVGLGGLGLAASFLPVGSLAYLAYATARSPIRTAKAALKAVREVRLTDEPRKKAASLSAGGDAARGLRRFLERLRGHGGDGGWYEALAYAALSEARTLDGALDIADAAVDRYPDPPPRPSADRLPGGKADGRPDSDFDPADLAAGQAVETEHTGDPALAREIARDHLAEDPDYYRKLRRVEGGGRRMAARRPLWSAYVGKRGARKGQKGWKNAKTGRVVWGDRPPAARPKGKAPAKKKPAAKRPAPKGPPKKAAPAKPAPKKRAPAKKAAPKGKPAPKRPAVKKAAPAPSPADHPATRAALARLTPAQRKAVAADPLRDDGGAATPDEAAGYARKYGGTVAKFGAPEGESLSGAARFADIARGVAGGPLSGRQVLEFVAYFPPGGHDDIVMGPDGLARDAAGRRMARAALASLPPEGKDDMAGWLRSTLRLPRGSKDVPGTEEGRRRVADLAASRPLLVEYMAREGYTVGGEPVSPDVFTKAR